MMRGEREKNEWWHDIFFRSVSFINAQTNNLWSPNALRIHKFGAPKTLLNFERFFVKLGFVGFFLLAETLICVCYFR
uniref:Uncharacterized protein n=1 Tax=Ascaris lumbricoides TaxID=6252 RepID=A0A0M3HI25_ASCLU